MNRKMTLREAIEFLKEEVSYNDSSLPEPCKLEVPAGILEECEKFSAAIRFMIMYFEAAEKKKQVNLNKIEIKY